MGAIGFFRYVQLGPRMPCQVHMMETAVWCLTIFLMLIGVVGVIVPLLPGTTLILLAAILHKLLQPADVSWLAIGFIAAFWLISIAADFGGVIVGTRLFGGSKWGMAGASGGALVGMFISLPALLLGTVLGAALAEAIIARKGGRASLKAALGAATGFILSTAARCACAAVMIGLFLVSALSGPR